MQRDKQERLPAPPKILLVDDDAVFRREFKECFEEYAVMESSNGQEALELLRKPNEIDLVILDVRMPGLNGIEVLGKIKTIAPEVGIIISTGYSSKDVAIEALRARADNYIEKPLEVEKTKGIIDKILEDKKIRTYAGYPADNLNGKIEKVKYFLQRNCFKKVSLDDAAETVYLSPKYLSRVFKQQTGKGFNDYKLALKIGKAKMLLKKSAYNIDQISDKLGYENTESFIRQFKKITGLTPTGFRKKNRK